jgi:ActR/RegA family two-component response regulator
MDSRPAHQPLVDVPPLAAAHRGVLLVDDDQGTVDTFAASLRRAGYRPEKAITGAMALQLAGATACDCAVIDVRLVDMSGLEVLRILRDGAQVKYFIVVSAWLSTSVVVEAMKLGATEVLDKAPRIRCRIRRRSLGTGRVS